MLENNITNRIDRIDKNKSIGSRVFCVLLKINWKIYSKNQN